MSSGPRWSREVASGKLGTKKEGARYGRVPAYVLGGGSFASPVPPVDRTVQGVRGGSVLVSGSEI